MLPSIVLIGRLPRRKGVIADSSGRPKHDLHALTILSGEGLRGLVGRGSWPGIPEACLVTALRSLPARQREALVLEYYAGWHALIGPTWPSSQPITAIPYC